MLVLCHRQKATQCLNAGYDIVQMQRRVITGLLHIEAYKHLFIGVIFIMIRVVFIMAVGMTAAW